MRNALNNHFCQSDVNGSDGTKSYYLRNFKGIDVPQGGTIYVDGSLTEETGKINSSLAFQSIALAVQMAPPGTLIIVRPGEYFYDGQILIRRPGVKLIGYGAMIMPLTEGEATGFAVAGGQNLIEGFEFDGGISAMEAVDSDGGVIQVGGANTVTIRNCYIHDSNFHGIYLPGVFPGVMIDNCRISGCNTGVNSPGIITETVAGMTIKNCYLSSNRNEAIKLNGINNAGGVFLKNIRIQNNDLISNDTAGASKAGINIGAGGDKIIIKGNYIFDHYDGVQLVKVKRCKVSGNEIESMRNKAIVVTGSQLLKITDNQIEGANQNTGNPLTQAGIGISGDYAAANDSGPIEITDNQFNQINSMFLSVSHASNVVVGLNQMKGPAAIEFIATQDVRVIGNGLSITSGNAIPITFDQSDRATTGVTVIIGNSIQTAGAPTKLIATTNANSLTMDTFIFDANTSTPGKTYSAGIVAHISGTAPTKKFNANAPMTTVVLAGAWDSRSGWVNDTMVALGTQEVDITRNTAAEKVIGKRKTPWGVPTGTLLRTTFVSYAGQDVSAGYTEAEAQATDDAVKAVSQRLAALITDLHADGASSTHGLLDDA